MPEPPSSHFPQPVSPIETGIPYDTSYPKNARTPSSRDQLRDFTYEPMSNSSRAPEVFDPVPCLILADWYMHNPDENHGLLTPNALFCLIKMGRLTLTDVRRSTHTIMSRSLIKTTNWKGSDTRSSSYPRMSQYPPLRTVYGYLVRLVLPLI
jgi:hypothetical protein